jgi:hypothetical protein
MEPSGLLLVCISAFVAVFLVLALLALIMRVITALFTFSASGGDPAVVAAITSTMSALYPGTHITNVEELK